MYNVKINGLVPQVLSREVDEHYLEVVVSTATPYQPKYFTELAEDFVDRLCMHFEILQVHSFKFIFYVPY